MNVDDGWRVKWISAGARLDQIAARDIPISASVSRTIGLKASSAFSATLTSVRTIVSLSGIRTPVVPLPAVDVDGKAVSASSMTVRTSLSACVFSAADLWSRAKVLD